jgi:hypothetical protein
MLELTTLDMQLPTSRRLPVERVYPVAVPSGKWDDGTVYLARQRQRRLQ